MWHLGGGWNPRKLETPSICANFALDLLCNCRIRNNSVFCVMLESVAIFLLYMLVHDYLISLNGMVTEGPGVNITVLK